MRTFAKVIIWGAGICLVLTGLLYAAFQVSPWPWVFLLRHSFDRGGELAARTLAEAAPHDVTSQLNIPYAPNDEDARLDVFFPSRYDNSNATLPTILWIHGGGWIAGNKEGIADYLRILAHEGYTTVGVEYSHAPEKTYPAQLHQINKALAFLVQHADSLHVDRSAIIVAGDSAGAYIAAQIIEAISDPSYAKLIGITPAISRNQLKAAVLYCGAYDPALEKFKGLAGQAAHAMLWSYMGERNYLKDKKLEGIRLTQYVTNRFPPTFISTGNGDPLLPQSRAFAKALKDHSVNIDELFFPDDHAPPVPHEYQFIFNSPAAQLSFQRLKIFFADVLNKNTADTVTQADK